VSFAGKEQKKLGFDARGLQHREQLLTADFYEPSDIAAQSLPNMSDDA
jgi:hypothetical protein